MTVFDVTPPQPEALVRAPLLVFFAALVLPSFLIAADPNEDLIKSAQRGDTKSVRFFLLAGADANTVGDSGETALMLARKGGHEETAAALVEAGAGELFFVSVEAPEDAAGPQARNAMETEDAFAPYTPGEWIVSPLEEPEGDIPAGTTPPECDIRGVLSCFDAARLRVDILLHHDVSPDRTVGYGVKLSYEGGVNEYFTYYPGLNRLYYTRETLGRIQKSHRLKGDRSSDAAGFAGRDVYLLVDKSSHMAGEKGLSYRVGALFYSLTLDRKMYGRLEDSTSAVNLRYTR